MDIAGLWSRPPQTGALSWVQSSLSIKPRTWQHRVKEMEEPDCSGHSGGTSFWGGPDREALAFC